MSLIILIPKTEESEVERSGVIYTQTLKGSHFQSPAYSTTLMPASQEYSNDKFVVAKDSELKSASQVRDIDDKNYQLPHYSSIYFD